MKTLPKESTDQKAPASSEDAGMEFATLASIQSDIENVELQVAKLDDLSETQVINSFKQITARITEFEFSLSKSRLQAQLQRWLAGTLLNKRKRQLGHGKFGKWREKKILETGIMSERTSQRFMDLADKYEDPRAMLKEEARPQEENPDSKIRSKGGKQKSGSISKAADLMASLTGLQKKLRLFEGSGERLKDEEVLQLKLMKAQLDRFFAPILTSSSAEGHAAERGDA